MCLIQMYTCLLGQNNDKVTIGIPRSAGFFFANFLENAILVPIMFSRLRTNLGRFDWVLLFAVVVLIVIGVTMVWSVALSRDPVDVTTVIKQVVALVIGLIAVFTLAAANYHLLKNYALVITIVAIMLLVLVLFFGQTIRGTTGWFSFAGWSFQPVEFAKFALVVFLAAYFSNHPRATFGLREFFASSVVAGVFVLLVLFEPDLGSALVLLATWIGLLAFARIRKRYFLLLVGGVAIFATIAWFFLAPFQQERILTFIDPARDPLGRGYNVAQAIIAVGSGELFGRGLGLGSQSQLRFLPESQTDFIFAVIAEQLGFVGVVVVLGFFFLLLWRMLCIAKSASDDFSVFLTLGILLIFTIQVMVNVGMNLGVMPVTGIGLPFVSYGGSSLVMALVMLGVVESAAARRSLSTSTR